MWYMTMQWKALAVDKESNHISVDSDRQFSHVFESARRILDLQGHSVDAAFTSGCLQTKECREILGKLGFDTRNKNTYSAYEVQMKYNKGMSVVIRDRRWPSQNVREFLRCLIELELGLSFVEK